MAMQNFHYCNPCDIYLGTDALARLPDLLSGRKVLIVSGGLGTKASGIVDDITGILSDNNIDWIELGGSSVPSYDRVQAGIEICHEAGVECVLSIEAKGVLWIEQRKVREDAIERAMHAVFKVINLCCAISLRTTRWVRCNGANEEVILITLDLLFAA